MPACVPRHPPGSAAAAAAATAVPPGSPVHAYVSSKLSGAVKEGRLVKAQFHSLREKVLAKVGVDLGCSSVKTLDWPDRVARLPPPPGKHGMSGRLLESRGKPDMPCMPGGGGRLATPVLVRRRGGACMHACRIVCSTPACVYARTHAFTCTQVAAGRDPQSVSTESHLKANKAKIKQLVEGYIDKANAKAKGKP